MGWLETHTDKRHVAHMFHFFSRGAHPHNEQPLDQLTSSLTRKRVVRRRQPHTRPFESYQTDSDPRHIITRGVFKQAPQQKTHRTAFHFEGRGEGATR